MGAQNKKMRGMSMKKFTFIILICCLSILSLAGKVTAQETVPVTSDYFGDQKFLQIVSEQADTTKDGFLTIEERKAVKKLDK